MKDDQNFKRRDVKKGGSNKMGESAMALGLKYLFDYFSRT